MQKLVVVVLLASACAPEEAPGLVLLDEGARERGYELLIDDELVSPVLPVEVLDGLEIFTDRGEVIEVPVELGEVVRIDADADGTLIERGRLGWDVASDEVMVEGEDDALDLIADSLTDADVVYGDLSATFTGPEVLHELAWAPETEGLFAVWTLELEPIDEPRAAMPSSASDVSFGASDASYGESSGPGSFGLGGLIASLFGYDPAAVQGSGTSSATIVALPDDALERRMHVGYYLFEGREVALSLDGKVRRGTREGRPIATWTVDPQARPVVMLGGKAMAVQRIRVQLPGGE